MSTRYRVGEDAGSAAGTVTDTMLTGTAIYGILVGGGFLVAGLRARQMWMTWWGGGLVLASIAYLVIDALAPG